MQPNFSSIGSILGNSLLLNGDLSEGFESSRLFVLVPFLLSQGGAMDLSKVGEKILSSVRSARSLGLLPSTSDRPEVPARAAAAAAVARALAGLPPHQRFNIASSSEELSSIYGSRNHSEVVEELEEAFYEEDFDPVGHILEHIQSEENELAYFEQQAALRLAQLDRVTEQLSCHVMEHYEVMVKGMDLVRELEKDLKVANVICRNGRRHLTSSVHEVSRDLIINSNSKRKQALLDMLPVLAELRHAMDMQASLESLVEEGNYFGAFRVLSEYLQLLDSFSEFSAIQEMSRGVEIWLGRTLQKLDSLLLGVCQGFQEESYLVVIDAYALIGDVSGLAEKIQSFFMQEVISESYSVLKSIVLEDPELLGQNNRLTYSDLCLQIPESKFRQCLLKTLAVLFTMMCSYYEILSFQLENKDSTAQTSIAVPKVDSDEKTPDCQGVNFSSSEGKETVSTSSVETTISSLVGTAQTTDETRTDSTAASTSGSPWYYLRKDAIAFVSQTLQRGCKNFWQLTTSRVSVLLSSAAVCSTSIHQFLKIYEDLNLFILAGEAFCGVEAVEFRQKLKVVCENYFVAFHKQNIHALKMVLEKESWMILPPDTVHIISFAGLVGDGAPLIVSSDTDSNNVRVLRSDKSTSSTNAYAKKSGFAYWFKSGNPFLLKVTHSSKESHLSAIVNGEAYGEVDGNFSPNCHNNHSMQSSDRNHVNNKTSVLEDENEDLFADFIDEDSQLPSRTSELKLPKNQSLHLNGDEVAAQTGSSLCLLKAMDKYARFMQKLDIINVEFFKGICQLFEVFFFFTYEAFGQQNINSSGKGFSDPRSYRLNTALTRITQDCDQWIKSHQLLSTSSNASLSLAEVTPSAPATNFGHMPGTSFGLKERCAAADTLVLIRQMMLRSKAHIQSMLLQKNASVIEDFFVHMVDAVPDLSEHIHRTTARLLLHINGYVDRIANAKWEVKELGLEHNGYVDLLLGEFKHYKTRLAHGGIRKELQDILSDYGLEIVAETLIEGLSRVRRCSDEGRALMSLDLQVLINGLQHFVPMNVKPKLQIVETFIKENRHLNHSLKNHQRLLDYVRALKLMLMIKQAYYLPETEYVHWARSHPEYTKNQIVGLVNLVATMKGWKRKTRLETIEKIERADS